MTIEEIKSVNEIDRFPIGMRVLAVDDNPTCLKVLDGLLTKCQYQVTTTNQAITALKMLRENRDRFDLIISDVYMPDMDGFKLLELVGLEMDLPVIMLSGNSDPKLVMKGIAHGACDYLVKPVRLQELQNIWQHVVRRKVESKSQSKSNNNENSDRGNDSGDKNVKVNRKRKEEDENEDNGNDSYDDDDDDQTRQKRPRVVWSIDLHRKFVAAVNQLGIEKAVPKRILDFMNVDGLTRENVASHLQKYRLYLKRISYQANMVVAFGGNKDSYMRMNHLDGVGDLRTLSCSGRLSNATCVPPGMLGRLNSGTGVTLQSLTNHAQNKLQPLVSLTQPNHQNMSLFQPSFALDHQQYYNKPNTQLTDFSSVEESRIFTGTKLADFSSIDEPRMFTGSSPFTGSVPVLRNQPPSFSSKQLPIGENFSYSATINGGLDTSATMPLEGHGGGLVGDIVPNVNQNQKSGLCGKQDYNQYSQNALNTLAFSSLASGGSLNVPVGHSKTNSGSSTLVQTEKPSMRSSEDYVLDQAKLQGGFIPSNGYGSLDDIMNGMMKREQDSTIIMGGEFGYDPYCFRQ